MKAELARSLEALQGEPTHPYFLGYDITEAHSITLGGSFGAVTERHEERHRALGVELRVGNYAFDNTHAVRSDFPDFSDFLGGGVEVPIENDSVAIRAVLWLQTDMKYRRAVERLARVRAGAEVKVPASDSSPDFSREPPERFTEAVTVLAVDRPVWEDRIRRYTAPFARHGDIYGADATFNATVDTRWYVNSEGAEIQTSQPIYRLQISAYSRADDGMVLPRFESYVAFSPDGLPSDSSVLRAVDRMIVDLEALRRAPVMEPYTGPAILSGRASAVFFHEILGHRLEGHRQKREDEGQTFTRRVNDAILPPGFSVSFDPTLRRLAGTDLVGSYRFDDEGVRARPVRVIDRGVLRTFLMSRSPIEGFTNSNGHGRRQVGFAPVARQSNLIVEVAQPRTRAQLKQMLVDEVRRTHKPFGLFFDDIEGGFTITTRDAPNAFEVLPIMVYRIFPDGREELVRGVDLIGTPLTVFSRITAGDDRVEVFNGLCGAESGLVPVSAVSPGVYIAQIEVQKKAKGTERAPILPPPPGPDSDTGDVVLKAMRDELARSMAQLRLDTLPHPYFIAYRIQDIEHGGAEATLGSLLARDEDRNRILSVEVRIGDYTFDNSNFLGVPTGSGDFGLDPGDVPLDDNYLEIRRQLWLATDGSYKEAVEDYGRKRAALANRTRREAVADFSREEVVSLRDEPVMPRIDRPKMESRLRQVSAVFRGAPEIYESGASWTWAVVRTWYVNSEGTSYVRVSPSTALHIHAATQATDGVPLQDAESAYGVAPANLPDSAALTDAARRMAALLTRLRQSPPAETYTGPVMFQGEAAAELVNGVLAPRLVAIRRPVYDDPMFERLAARGEDDVPVAVGSRVLPRSFTVTDDPTSRIHEGQSVSGYLVDDDGVRARATSLVEHGILRALLTTRVPAAGMPHSTGSRRGHGAAVSNVFVATDSGLTTEQLRSRLLALAAERGLPYAIIVRRLGNPFLSAGRDPMAMIASLRGAGEASISMAVAAKVFPDGHEEPLRNASLLGVTATTFRNIVAATRSRAVVTTSLHGRMGGSAMFVAVRRSGFIRFPEPMASYVVPSLLFDELSLRGPTDDGSRLPVIKPPWAPEER
jgi:predicted Zn-dependent protease